MNEDEIGMVCDELVELVTEYLEATISGHDRERLDAHLRECEWCVRYVEQTRAVAAALRELADEPPDPEALRRALTAFRETLGE